jgi:hypothetical protein
MESEHQQRAHACFESQAATWEDDYALYLELSVTRLALERWASLAADPDLWVSPIGPCNDPLALVEVRRQWVGP